MDQNGRNVDYLIFEWSLLKFTLPYIIFQRHPWIQKQWPTKLPIHSSWFFCTCMYILQTHYFSNYLLVIAPYTVFLNECQLHFCTPINCHRQNLWCYEKVCPKRNINTLIFMPGSTRPASNLLKIISFSFITNSKHLDKIEGL